MNHREELHSLADRIIDALPEHTHAIHLLGALGRVTTAVLKSLPIPEAEKIRMAKGFGEALVSTVDSTYSKETLAGNLAALFDNKPTTH